MRDVAAIVCAYAMGFVVGLVRGFLRAFAWLSVALVLLSAYRNLARVYGWPSF